MHPLVPRLALLLAAWPLGPNALAAGRFDPPSDTDADTDGDGLPDFHETHKYFTDPASADSDGDGIPDGDWFERREYTYTLRTVVQVAPPVTDDVLCDDYQDARILERRADYVELEVVHYPLNTVSDAIVPDVDWRRTVDAHADALREYIDAGPTSNWDDELRAILLRDLAAAGIDAESLDDATLVREAARFLLARTDDVNLFTTFSYERGPDGVPRAHPFLAGRVERGARDAGLSVPEAMQRELFAKGMYVHRTRGSCTSSAIYLGGCLRALGVPTRVVLTIPVIDASDERERELVNRISHPGVRRAVEAGTRGMEGSWASHTYNEVFVGGRWRRLNYTDLGQNILDPDYFGLMTHVATVADWLDGGFAETIGVRQSRRPVDDVFGHANPYSCLTLSDQLGPHATFTLPEDDAVSKLETLTIERAYWYSDPERPEIVDLGPSAKGERGHVLVRVVEGDPERGVAQFRPFYGRAGHDFVLRSEGRPDVLAHAERGYWFDGESGVRDFYLRIPERELARMEPGVAYALVPRNGDETYQWRVRDGVTLTLREPAVRDSIGDAAGSVDDVEPGDTRTVAAAFWSDAEACPDWLDLGDLYLLVEPEEDEEWQSFKAFTACVDGEFLLEAEGHPSVRLAHGVGGCSGQGRRFAMLSPIGRDAPVTGVAYTLRARNEARLCRWQVPEGLVVQR